MINLMEEPSAEFFQPKTCSKQYAKVAMNKVMEIRTYKVITVHKSGCT